MLLNALVWYKLNYPYKGIFCIRGNKMGKELEKVKDKKNTLKINGKEREIRFNFSAWATLEEEYGGLKNLGNLQKEIEDRPFKTLPHLIYIGLVDKEGVDEKTVLDDYGIGDIEYIGKVVEDALENSLPTEEKKAEKEAKK
jgi:hypothetical protein